MKYPLITGMHIIEIAYVSNNRFWEYLAIIELPPCHLAFANCIGHSAGHRGRSLTISDDAGDYVGGRTRAKISARA